MSFSDESAIDQYEAPQNSPAAGPNLILGSLLARPSDPLLVIPKTSGNVPALVLPGPTMPLSETDTAG